MKLNCILAAVAIAKEQNWRDAKKNGDREGKHGRVQIGSDSDADRLLLHYPICMSYPDHPDCDSTCVKTFTANSGTIEIKDYESYRSCLWEIKLPPTKTITFQFVGDFDLEYHYKCGYDRVHIFSGEVDGDNQRQGRFCGPRHHDDFPYDGSGRNVAVNGKMNFFSSPYDIHNNNAIVGFDADQNMVGGGFKLVWNSHNIYDYDFTDVFQAHEFVTNEAARLFGSVMFNTDKEKKKFTKLLHGRITASSLRALKNNPGSDGPKKRRCAKSEDISVSNNTVQMMKDLSDNENPDFRDAMDALQALIVEYLGNCKIGGEKWPKRVSSFAAAIESQRLI